VPNKQQPPSRPVAGRSNDDGIDDGCLIRAHSLALLSKSPLDLCILRCRKHASFDDLEKSLFFSLLTKHCQFRPTGHREQRKQIL
jgi:hypothetical protein